MTQAVYNNAAEKNKSVKRLPGSEGVYIIIFGDMCVFGLFFGTYLYYRSLNIELYNASQLTLSEGLGLLNTFLLLTSSWLVVWATKCARQDIVTKARQLLLAAIGCGVGFCAVKVVEYSRSFSQGRTIISDEFFMFYFMYTGIHLVHVIIGLAVLTYIYRRLNRIRLDAGDIDLLDSGAAFWHLVDLLWVVLFALIYLVK